MSAKAKKLGRGLDSLIRRSADSEPEASEADSGIQNLDPKQITVNRDQPRQEFDAERIAELAQSIRAHGIVQPLVVHRQESGSFELVAGERRLRAALELGLKEVPVVVREYEPAQLLDLALIENIQREDLNAIELAEAYQALKERHGWTQAQLAEHIGKKRSSVANVLRYLDLPDPVQAGLKSGAIKEGHVKVLLSVKDPELQLSLFEQTIEWGLTVRDLESRIQAANSGGTSGSAKAKSKGGALDPQVTEQAELLSAALGTKVEIKPGSKGRGKIVIEYYSGDDYERLRARLAASERR